MRPCEHRTATGWGGWFFCRHPEVETPHGNHLVTPKECNSCGLCNVAVAEPVVVPLEMPTPPDQKAKKKKPLPTRRQLDSPKSWDIDRALATYTPQPGRTVALAQFDQRLKICDKCPERKPGSNACTQCGCNLLFKAADTSFTCPLGFWPHLSEAGGLAVRKLRLQATDVSPGDIVTLTAAVRDLHRAHPGKFLTHPITTAQEIWDHNPHVTEFVEDDPNVEIIDCHYDLVNESNERPYHFVHGYAQHLEEVLGVSIPLTEFKGDIHLSEEEQSWINQIEQYHKHKGPYWIIMAGGKHDFTAKWWNPDSYQKVVDHFRGRVQFIQCGESRAATEDEHYLHFHPSLDGVIDLVGKTDTRQFIRLMYWAQGVVCGITFGMHLAAAVPTPPGRPRSRACVVIAGGREGTHWEAYPNHQYISLTGVLPCNEQGGCWKSRCQTIPDEDHKNSDLCVMPVEVKKDLHIPKCMEMIRPEDVIRRIEMYLDCYKTW